MKKSIFIHVAHVVVFSYNWIELSYAQRSFSREEEVVFFLDNLFKKTCQFPTK